MFVIKEKITNHIKEIVKIEEENNRFLKMKINEFTPLSIMEIMKKLNNGLTKEQKAINEIIKLVPNGEYRFYNELNPGGVLHFDLSSGTYHFILNELLPMRPKYDVGTHQFYQFMDRDILFSSYRKIVTEYEKQISNTIVPRNQKIEIHIINNFSKKDQWIDNDNIDAKQFIDACINKVFVPDDNPRYCVLKIEGRETEKEKSYSEIYVKYI